MIGLIPFKHKPFLFGSHFKYVCVENNLVPHVAKMFSLVDEKKNIVSPVISLNVMIRIVTDY